MISIINPILQQLRFSVPVLVGASLAFSNMAVATPSPRKAPTVRAVAVIADSTLDAPGHYGITKLEEALRAKGVKVTEGSGALAGSDFAIVAGLGAGSGEAAHALQEIKAPAPAGAEALAIRTGAKYKGKPALILAGADANGLMYAALDLADRVGWAKTASNPFEFARNVNETPVMKERGVAMFTMNRAYFESRLLDEKFWSRYFDMLAKDRFNCLVLTFGYEDGGYMAPLYPYFFNVDGFPDVHVVGLSAAQQQRNLAGLRTMFRLAEERGIHVKPGIWEHIYRGRLHGQDGANPWASDGTKPVPGLVWGLDSKNFIPYTVAALKKFYELFPEINETQFRMHDESGLNKDEIERFWHEVFGFYSANRRNVMLELRAKGLPKSVIKDAQAQGLKIQVDTKIWMEQMGLPYHPTHINKENQMDARQGYADLLEYPQTYHMNWTLWNGGTTRLLLWGDPDYARRIIESARLYDGQGFTVTEMEATKMLGESHDTPPRDFLNARYRYYDYEFERYWDFYLTFGRLAYDPNTSSDAWEQEFVQRFGAAAAPHVSKALQLSSEVLPRINAASIPYRMFPTTMGWVEMMHLGSLPEFAETEEGSDIQQFESLRDEAASIINGTDTAMRRPEETSRWFAQTSDAILEQVAAAEKALGSTVPSNEFKSTMTDAKILAALARYHSWRQLGGVNYNLYKQAGDLGAFDAAIADERNAVQAWQDVVDDSGDFYIDNMAFGPSGRNFPHHWKDELSPLRAEFNQLLAERKTATPRADAKPVSIAVRDSNSILPVVFFEPGQSLATPGHDYIVKIKVTAPEGVKWIRLRYRHLNQKEDYQTAEMAIDSTSGAYAASIPASFIDPQWDLMYFVEIVDKKGNGRVYPDLEIETPYKALSVKR